jgi:hypothetical protein
MTLLVAVVVPLRGDGMGLQLASGITATMQQHDEWPVVHQMLITGPAGSPTVLLQDLCPGTMPMSWARALSSVCDQAIYQAFVASVTICFD